MMIIYAKDLLVEMSSVMKNRVCRMRMISHFSSGWRKMEMSFCFQDSEVLDSTLATVSPGEYSE